MGVVDGTSAGSWTRWVVRVALVAAVSLVAATFSAGAGAQTSEAEPGVDPPSEAQFAIDARLSPEELDRVPDVLKERLVSDLVGAREGLFLPTDVESLRAALLGDVAAESYDDYGAPLTQAEWDGLKERFALEDSLRALQAELAGFDEVSYVRMSAPFEELAIHVGVVGSTERVGAVLSADFAGDPVVVEASDLTRDEVDTLIPRAIAAWESASGVDARLSGFVASISADRADQIVISVGPDHAENRVLTPIEWATVEGAATEAAAVVERETKVPTTVVAASEVGTDDACKRWSCWPTLRAGLNTKRSNGQGLCTMAFHVRQGGYSRYLSAAHCTYGSKPNARYHDQQFVGNMINDNLYVDDGYDAAILIVSPSADSNLFYKNQSNPSQTVTQAKTTIFTSGDQWTQICKSGAASYFTCGYVVAAYGETQEGSGDCGCDIWVVNSSYFAKVGDSGAPVVKKGFISGCSYKCRIAYGIHQGGGGSSGGTSTEFTPLHEVFSYYGLTLHP